MRPTVVKGRVRLSRCRKCQEQWSRRRIPLGYRVMSGSLVVEPTEAMFVRELYFRYARRGDLYAVARQLRVELALPPIRLTTPELGGLQRILRDPVYVGIVQRAACRGRGHHRPIVSRSLWKRVQTLLDNSR